MSNLLDEIRTKATVDVDSMDPAVAARHVTKTTKFHNMTSNQALVYIEAVRPERAHILKAACDRAKNAGADLDDQVSAALDLLTVLLAKEVLPYLNGRVLAQTSPALAHDTQATTAHAKRLVQLFEAEGIPRSRVCVKIPATPEAIIACQHLEQAGIRTLGTCLFAVPQALAASQAGCLYISPYVNELRVHFDPTSWRAYDDTVRDHPSSPVIVTIIKTFKAIESKTLVMPASVITPEEVIALTTMGPDHLTLSGAILDKIAAQPYREIAAQTVHTIDISDEVLQVDYLADSAQALRNAFAQDAEATRKMEDALKIFDEMEQKTKTLIRAQLSS